MVGVLLWDRVRTLCASSDVVTVTSSSGVSGPVEGVGKKTGVLFVYPLLRKQKLWKSGND